MGLGLVLGFIVQLHHDKRHAAAKAGWLLILIGFFSLMMIVGGGTPPGGTAVNGWMGNKVAHALATTIFAPFTANVFFIPGLTMGLPLISVIMIVAGIPIVAIGEGPIIAVLETLTLLSNIISYGRLAAVGIAEAGIHLGINNILLPQIESGELTAIVWFMLLFIAQLFVFILGGLSAGIQSLRLHFFEQFTKFYTGGGKEFAPFGRKLRYVTE
jgi:vacuolar-type H+-ATPase subunit I/STV1